MCEIESFSLRKNYDVNTEMYEGSKEHGRDPLHV